METRDALGRRRQAAQNRGLRPLFPRLPQGWRSRLVRIAMSDNGWSRIDAILETSEAQSMPRAFGEMFEELLALRDARDEESAPVHMRPREEQTDYSDWQLWQKEKELNLLRSLRVLQ